MFDFTQNDDINQEEIESGLSGFPRLRFLNGSPKAQPVRKGDNPGANWYGGFSIDMSLAERFQDVDWSGWQEDARIPESGKDAGKVIPVMWTRKITFVQVQRRRCWRPSTPQGEGQSPLVFPWSKYSEAVAASTVGKAAGEAECLLIIKGLENAGPLLFGCAGNVQMYWFGDKQAIREVGVLSTHRDILHKAANLFTGLLVSGKDSKAKATDFHAWWMTAEANKNADGTPKFIKSGEADTAKPVIVPVAADLPAPNFYEAAIAAIKADLNIVKSPASNPVVKAFLETLGNYQVAPKSELWQQILRLREDHVAWKAEWDEAKPVVVSAAPQAATVNDKEAEEAGY